MGAGASAANLDSIRGQMAIIIKKPLDASDVDDIEKAKDEIKILRSFAKQLEEKFPEEFKGKDPTGAKNEAGKKRAAVMDKGAAGGGGSIDTSNYVPKVVTKAENIKSLLFGVVQSNNLFKSYAHEDHVAIVDAFDSKDVGAGINVITQGEAGDEFYVVETGSLDIFIDGVKVGNSLRAGSSFGELALMYNTPRAATITASENCKLWVIDRLTYRGILVFNKFLRNKEYLELLRNVKIGDKELSIIMSPTELEQMAVALDKATFQDNEKILIQGNTGDDFFIIADGQVKVVVASKEGVEEQVATLKKGNYFGEKALLSADVRGASIIADGQVTCLTLEREDFLNMFGSFNDLLNKDPNAVPDAPPVSVESEGILSFSLDMNLADLDVKKTLGCGAFGRVKLCYHKASDRYYALKCQSKRAITESGLQDHVLQEMRVMRRIDHPYIAKLYCALQDNIFIYFVLELLQGGEVFTHLRNKGKLSEQAARFYAATVVYAFTTIHSQKIAYRDLKPENLVMDSNGFVKLVDFGLAKQLLSGKTWTLCGTPDYLAPEIILNEGHDLAVDYWALGILIFEMVVGSPPFYGDDPMEVYEKILSGNPTMPAFFTRNLSDLIKKLLRSQQAKRLGNTRGGTASVVKHKWFSTFEWALLESGDAKPPFKPTVTGPEDVANFDEFDEGGVPPPSDWMPDLSQ